MFSKISVTHYPALSLPTQAHYTALVITASEGEQSIVQLLLNGGANVHLPSRICTLNDCGTALNSAVVHGHLNIV